MYILLCGDGSYYTGSTRNLERRLHQHQNGEGAIHTKTHQPVLLAYSEEFHRIDYAFNREKQVQRWGHEKKRALIDGRIDFLKKLAKKKFNRPSASLDTTADAITRLAINKSTKADRVLASIQPLTRSLG